MLKVALDYASNWEIRGGVWRYGVELSRALTNILPPDHVLVPCYDRLPDDSLRELHATGARVLTGLFSHYDRLIAMASRNGRIVPWRRLLKPVNTPAVRELLFQNGLDGADVCHAIFTCRGTPANGVSIGTVHDVIPLLHPDGSDLTAKVLLEVLEAQKRTSELVIVPSEATKRDIINHCGFAPERIRVIYHGINHQLFRPVETASDPLLEQYGLRPGQFFLYVGAIERRKNLERLVEAYHAAIPDRASFPLVLAGAKLHAMPAIEQALGDPSSGVKHIGYVTDEQLPALYSAARAVTQVAPVEGFGFTPLEAMACGTPAVVSRTTATGEIVAGAGLLVGPTDVDEIASALTRMRHEHDFHKRLGEEATRHARSFTWEKCARQTYDVYVEGTNRVSKRGTASASRTPGASRDVAIKVEAASGHRLHAELSLDTAASSFAQPPAARGIG